MNTENPLNPTIELRLFYFPKVNSTLKAKYTNEVSVFAFRRTLNSYAR